MKSDHSPAMRAPGSGPGLMLPELREALASGWLSTRYQPVVHMATRQPVALEVLARIEHPTRGTLTPDLFIPQMEDAGLAWPLTQAVVRRALADWSDGLSALDLSLAFNFPLDVLLLPQAREWLDAECAAAGIGRDRVTIELTESHPVSGLDSVRSAVAHYRAAGYELAIDDVGPDVRDHSPLLGLAFSILKLDKNMVRRSVANEPVRAFMLKSIAAARSANLILIAEGIEEPADWDRMAALGVEQAQGYLIARPMPARDVPGWFRAWRAH